VTAPTRETAGTVRSAHVAYFMPPDWARITKHAAPALERASGDTPAVRLLVLVPDAGAALLLTRYLSALPAAKGRRLVAATSPARLQRLLGAARADAVIGTPESITAALGASALQLDAVKTVIFAAADELDAESDTLAAVLAEIPKDAARLLTALEATAGVEAIIERYMHRARRVTEDVAPAEDAPAAATVRYLTVNGPALEALPAILDELDAPSAAVLANDEESADAARAVLHAIGYTEGPLAVVTLGEVAPNTSLVVTLGVPTATAWQAAVTAQPAQIVAIVAPRDLEALRLLAGAATPRPLADRASISRARASEARRRAELRAELAEGIPSREVLALEPLLREYDGLEIAAAVLRLLERTRTNHAEQITAAEQRVRTQMREAQKEKEDAEKAERGEGPPRGFKGRSDGPREFRPRGDGPPRGDRPPRSYPPRDRDDKPRGGFSRDDKPRTSSFSRDRDDKPRTSSFSKDRDDKPRTSSFSKDRDDKPRGSFSRDDKPRGGGFGRSGDKPRGSRPPRGDR